MLKRKNCPSCGERIKKNYEFCPSCGTHIKTGSKKDWGMIGKNDFTEDEFPSVFGGLTGGILNKMINSTMKMLEKELSKEMKNTQKTPKSNIRLMINGKEVTPFFNQVKENKIPKKILPINFSPEKLKKFQSSKKKEPKTQIRRIGDKVSYELDVPGVDSIDNISIIRLENGIEVKALGKDKAYSKIINVNLPLSRYMLSNEKLMLELDTLDNSQSL